MPTVEYEETCSTCGGAGYTQERCYQMHPVGADYFYCPICDGTNYVKRSCNACGSTGKIKRSRWENDTSTSSSTTNSNTPSPKPRSSSSKRSLSSHERLSEGSRCFNEGLYDEAIIQYDALIAGCYFEGISHFYRGVCYWKKNDAKNALTDFDLAVRKGAYMSHPKEINRNADAHFFRGMAYEKTGNKEMAIGNYEAALKMEPNNTNARNKLNNAKQMWEKENGRSITETDMNIFRLKAFEPDHLWEIDGIKRKIKQYSGLIDTVSNSEEWADNDNCDDAINDAENRLHSSTKSLKITVDRLNELRKAAGEPEIEEKLLEDFFDDVDDVVFHGSSINRPVGSLCYALSAVCGFFISYIIAFLSDTNFGGLTYFVLLAGSVCGFYFVWRKCKKKWLIVLFVLAAFGAYKLFRDIGEIDFNKYSPSPQIPLKTNE